MARYEALRAGEWVQPVGEGYKIACCDCGLVHKMDFRVHSGLVQFRVSRDNRATGQVRRHGCFMTPRAHSDRVIFKEAEEAE